MKNKFKLICWQFLQSTQKCFFVQMISTNLIKINFLRKHLSISIENIDRFQDAMGKKFTDKKKGVFYQSLQVNNQYF